MKLFLWKPPQAGQLGVELEERPLVTRRQINGHKQPLRRKHPTRIARPNKKPRAAEWQEKGFNRPRPRPVLGRFPVVQAKLQLLALSPLQSCSLSLSCSCSYSISDRRWSKHFEQKRDYRTRGLPPPHCLLLCCEA